VSVVGGLVPPGKRLHHLLFPTPERKAQKGMTAWFREREKVTEIFGFSFLATGRSVLWKSL
jgi:hypothetical protein